MSAAGHAVWSRESGYRAAAQRGDRDRHKGGLACQRRRVGDGNLPFSGKPSGHRQPEAGRGDCPEFLYSGLWLTHDIVGICARSRSPHRPACGGAEYRQCAGDKQG